MPNQKGYVTRWFTGPEHNLIVTSGFGPRRYQNSQGVWVEDFHRGVDFGGRGKRGTPIKTPEGGTVTQAGFDGSPRGYGYFAAITMPRGEILVMAHFDKLHVKRGDKVKRGDVIGDLGATGNVTGPHVHVQINRAGTNAAGVNYWGHPDDYIFDTTTPAGSRRKHLVQQGDYLAKIAQQYQRTVGDLIAWNKDKYPSIINNPGLIKVGWELWVDPPEEITAPVDDRVLDLEARLDALEGDVRKLLALVDSLRGIFK